MNTLVGEISSLVWQNEPLPPPPADHLTPSTIPDFEKTPTNELASPSPFCNNTETDGGNFNYPINNVHAEVYENCQLPELPPRQPTLPPRRQNSSSSRESPRENSPASRDVTAASRDGAVAPRDAAPPQQRDSVPSKPDLPQRIPLSSREKLAPFLPPRDKETPLRTNTLPSRNHTSRDVAAVPRDSALPPRTIPLPPRDGLTRSNSMPRGGSSQTLPPRVQPRAVGISPPHRIPGPVPRLPSENGAPNLPPRIRADSSQHVRHDPSLANPPMPTRVPLPRPGPPGPVYTEVERQAGQRVPRVIHQHEFSPYVVPNAPRIDRWEEYTSTCADKKSQTLKKKVKVKIPQR